MNAVETVRLEIEFKLRHSFHQMTPSLKLLSSVIHLFSVCGYPIVQPPSRKDLNHAWHSDHRICQRKFQRKDKHFLKPFLTNGRACRDLTTSSSPPSQIPYQQKLNISSRSERRPPTSSTSCRFAASTSTSRNYRT